MIVKTLCRVSNSILYTQKQETQTFEVHYLQREGRVHPTRTVIHESVVVSHDVSHIDWTLRCRRTVHSLTDYLSTLLGLIGPIGQPAHFTELTTMSRPMYRQLDHPGDVQSETDLLTVVCESRTHLSTIYNDCCRQPY